MMYRCGGHSSAYGFCGADDCSRCHPGGSDLTPAKGKTAGPDHEILKDWAEHVQKNRRRWEGRKHDADDWYDEALAFAERYWKFHNLDPWDDIPQREVEDYAEDNAPDMLSHVNAPGEWGCWE